MDAKKTSKKKSRSRREMLKKVGKVSAFAVPTIVSLKVADLAVAGSGGLPPRPPGSLP